MKKMLMVMAMLSVASFVFADWTATTVSKNSKNTSVIYSSDSVTVDSSESLDYTINLNDYNHFTDIPFWYKMSSTQTAANKNRVKLEFQGAADNVERLYKTFFTIDSGAFKPCSAATGTDTIVEMDQAVTNYLRIQINPHKNDVLVTKLKFYFAIPKKGL